MRIPILLILLDFCFANLNHPPLLRRRNISGFRLPHSPNFDDSMIIDDKEPGIPNFTVSPQSPPFVPSHCKDHHLKGLLPVDDDKTKVKSTTTRRYSRKFIGRSNIKNLQKSDSTSNLTNTASLPELDETLDSNQDSPPLTLSINDELPRATSNFNSFKFLTASKRQPRKPSKFFLPKAKKEEPFLDRRSTSLNLNPNLFGSRGSLNQLPSSFSSHSSFSSSDSHSSLGSSSRLPSFKSEPVLLKRNYDEKIPNKRSKSEKLKINQHLKEIPLDLRSLLSKYLNKGVDREVGEIPGSEFKIINMVSAKITDSQFDKYLDSLSNIFRLSFIRFKSKITTWWSLSMSKTQKPAEEVLKTKRPHQRKRNSVEGARPPGKVFKINCGHEKYDRIYWGMIFSHNLWFHCEYLKFIRSLDNESQDELIESELNLPLLINNNRNFLSFASQKFLIQIDGLLNRIKVQEVKDNTLRYIEFVIFYAQHLYDYARHEFDLFSQVETIPISVVFNLNMDKNTIINMKGYSDLIVKLQKILITNFQLPEKWLANELTSVFDSGTWVKSSLQEIANSFIKDLSLQLNTNVIDFDNFKRWNDLSLAAQSAFKRFETFFILLKRQKPKPSAEKDATTSPNISPEESCNSISSPIFVDQSVFSPMAVNNPVSPRNSNVNPAENPLSPRNSQVITSKTPVSTSPRVSQVKTRDVSKSPRNSHVIIVSNPTSPRNSQYTNPVSPRVSQIKAVDLPVSPRNSHVRRQSAVDDPSGNTSAIDNKSQLTSEFGYSIEKLDLNSVGLKFCLIFMSLCEQQKFKVRLEKAGIMWIEKFNLSFSIDLLVHKGQVSEDHLTEACSNFFNQLSNLLIDNSSELTAAVTEYMNFWIRFFQLQRDLSVLQKKKGLESLAFKLDEQECNIVIDRLQKELEPTKD
jgi:hypothetical protein